MTGVTKILVVDDERGIREGCRRILSDDGYTVETASDGKEALELIKQGKYDLLLVDLMMPVMGGLELMDEVARMKMEINIIVITGFATVETAVDAMKHGAYDYLPKPFSPDQLLAVVKRAMDNFRLRIQARELMEERDRRLLEVANEKSKIRAIVNSMADAVIVMNRDHQLVLWNPAAIRFLSLSQSLEAGKDINLVLPEGLVKIIYRALEPEAVRYTSISEEIELGSPEPKMFLANISVVRDESAEMLGVVTILNDITKLKEIDKIKSQFVSMVAHELRAPLSAIESYLDAYLTNAAGEDPKFKEHMLNRAKDRAHSLLDLVNDLLQISRLESMRVARKKEPLDISIILDNTIDLLSPQANQRNIKIEKKFSAPCQFIEADRAEMEQLFTNLISNAIKYNVENGQVVVRCSVVQNFLEVVIEDTGIGIDAEHMEDIFDDFFRVIRPETRYIPGTGLGLSIVKKILESHYGRINVKSKLNEGTRFTLTFPLKGTID
ncbi:MAG: response regulator [Candidatus Zhuqueibacterota bacterium]